MTYLSLIVRMYLYLIKNKSFNFYLYILFNFYELINKTTQKSFNNCLVLVKNQC
jgi:hypothetical protein